MEEDSIVCGAFEGKAVPTHPLGFSIKIAIYDQERSCGGPFAWANLPHTLRAEKCPCSSGLVLGRLRGVAGEANIGKPDDGDALAELQELREILRGDVPPPTIEEDVVVSRVKAAVSAEVTGYHRDILKGLSELRGSLRRLEERVERLEGDRADVRRILEEDLEQQRELIHRLIDTERGSRVER